MKKNYIKFWGVRGSRPTAENNKLKYGGETSCVEIRTQNNEIIILDMGTGINALGKSLLNESDAPKEINIFLSHYHWDHLLGFLNFTPLFDEKFTFNIYGNNKSTSINDISKKLLDEAFWPVSFDMLKAKINFIDLNDKSVEIGKNILVENAEHIHPNGATSYKISIDDFKLTYSTDCEHSDNILNEDVISLAKNSDVLIHDSHFTADDLENHKGWGHSSFEQATLVAKKANIKKLVLFHFSPDYTDAIIDSIDIKAKELFNETVTSRQGLEIEF